MEVRYVLIDLFASIHSIWSPYDCIFRRKRFNLVFIEFKVGALVMSQQKDTDEESKFHIFGA